MSNVKELEVTIAALDIQPIDAALVELCRITARQMDSADGQPSTRLAAIYLSLLRNLRKIGTAPAASGTLTTLREMRPRPTPSKRTVRAAAHKFRTTDHLIRQRSTLTVHVLRGGRVHGRSLWGSTQAPRRRA